MYKKVISLLLCIALIVGFLPMAYAGTVQQDVEGHWASLQLEKWVSQGLLTGYPDGSVKPDKEMTRAEFTVLVNTVFGFSQKGDTLFTDVDPKDWYADSIAAAKKAGYISGFMDGSFKPKEAITREQAAHIISGLFHLPSANEQALSGFHDENLVSNYAKDALGRLRSNGYFQGYPDQTIRPLRAVSRAETVALLERIVPHIVNVSGTYNELNTEGNKLVNSKNVTLQNSTVNGNVFLTAGVGEGDIALEQLTIKGTLFVNGGGENSIHITGSTIDKVVVNKQDTPVRVVVSGDSQIQNMDVETMAVIEVSEESTLESLDIKETAGGTSIHAKGTIKNVKNNADDVVLNEKKMEKGKDFTVEKGVLPHPPTVTPGNGQPGSGGGQPDNGEDDWTLVWSDEFDRSGDNLDTNGVDLDKWDYQLGTGAQYGLDGWGNNEEQYYRAENAVVQDSKLIIQAKNDGYEDKAYTSARLYTQPTYTKKYGKFEARIKLPEGEGYWPAFWMMPAESEYGTWAASGEIDIMEAKGRLLDHVGGTIHYGKNWPNNKQTGDSYYFDEGSDITDFHVYSLEREPGELRWYVDGELYQTLNNWDSIGADQPTKYAFPAPFDKEFYIILNLAIGGNYDGGRVPDDSMIPAAMEVDYVRVYELTGREYRDPIEPSVELEDLPSDIKEPIEGSYIHDLDYEHGFNEVTEPGVEIDSQYWNFVHVSTFMGNGSASVEDISGTNFAKIDITNGGNAAHAVQLIQNVTLGKGRWYKLTYDAKSNTNRTMSVKFGGGESRGWTTYSDSWEESLSSEVKSYERTFQMKKDTDSLARLEINVGLNTNTVWVGNAKLVETVAPELYPDGPKTPLNGNHVYNGTFDLGRMDRMTYWNLVQHEGAATATVDTEVRELKVNITNGGLNEASIQLQQPGMNLSQNNEYKLTFKARADEERNIEVALKSKDESTNYSEITTIPLNQTMEEKTVNFSMTHLTDTEGLLTFLLGGQVGNVHIDDVVLIRLTNNIDLSGVSVFPLNNGDFSSGLDVWKTYAIEGGAAAFTEENGESKVSITDVSDQPWKVMLNQENMIFSNGITYVLSFDASASVPRPIEAVIDDANYSRLIDAQIDLTTETKSFAYEFTMSKDDTLSLKFLMGKVAEMDPLGAHDIFIDNVKLEMKNAPVQKAPYLKADPERNLAGQALEFTFIDNEAWRTAVTTVRVNDQDVTSDQYVFTAGKLTITADSFADPGEYTVIVSAEGYVDAVAMDSLFPLSGSDNKVTNGTFDTDVLGWNLYKGDGSDATVTQDTYGGGSMKVSFTNYDGWNPWSTQVYQTGVNLESGNTYELVFQASATAPKDMIVSIEKATDYTVKYLTAQTISLMEGLQDYRYTFTVGENEMNAKLLIQLGSENAEGPHYEGQSVYLNDIGLYRVPVS